MANTRQAIVDAARQLFAERGFFATRVDDIAELARVAPATVYAVSGGKQGLLSTLTKMWTSAPIIDENRAAMLVARDPVEVIRIAGHVTRRMREDFGDIMRVALNTGPHDSGAAESLAVASARYRSDLGEIAGRLAHLGALRAGLTESDAAELLWFYFGFASMFTLTDDLGWSYERAEQWLTEAAIRDLL